MRSDTGEAAGEPVPARTVLLTAGALAAFAANSLLCRAALASEAIDPGSFTAARLASGAAALWLLVRWRASRGPAGEKPPAGGNWSSAGFLFLYAIAFSWAYVTLSAGAGALILFGAVQLTMIAHGLARGERFSPLAWLGFALAVAGLIYLMLPGWATPHPLGAGLMAAAGAAWGLYSVRGRGNSDPLAATGGNFLRAVVPALGVGLLGLVARQFHLTPWGLLLAALSGAVTSGLGYVLWYAALRGLSSTRAAVVQLAVPVIAAAAAVPLLGEPLTGRLVLAAALVLGGVGLAIGTRSR